MDGVYAFNRNVIAHENNHIFTEIAINSQSIGNAFAESGTHDDVSYSSVTVVKRLNVGDSVLIRTPAESNLASRRNIVSFHKTNICLAFNLSSGFRLIHTTKRYYNKCKHLNA